MKEPPYWILAMLLIAVITIVIYSNTHGEKMITPTQIASDLINQYPEEKGNVFIEGLTVDMNALGYYTDLHPSSYDNNWHTREYNWVILVPNSSRNSELNKSQWESFRVPIVVERWGDTADPIHHKFYYEFDLSDPDAGFVLYRRRLANETII